MSIQPRLIVTGHDADGRSVFVTDEPGDPISVGAVPGSEFHMLWGLMDVFEPDAPGMHTTDSVDYGICLEGELYLELDDGEEVRLTPGACVVQRGTRHAWHNRSDRPALMCYVLIGADRTP